MSGRCMSCERQAVCTRNATDSGGERSGGTATTERAFAQSDPSLVDRDLRQPPAGARIDSRPLVSEDGPSGHLSRRDSQRRKAARAGAASATLADRQALRPGTVRRGEQRRPRRRTWTAQTGQGGINKNENRTESTGAKEQVRCVWALHCRACVRADTVGCSEARYGPRAEQLDDAATLQPPFIA